MDRSPARESGTFLALVDGFTSSINYPYNVTRTALEVVGIVYAIVRGHTRIKGSWRSTQNGSWKVNGIAGQVSKLLQFAREGGNERWTQLTALKGRAECENITLSLIPEHSTSSLSPGKLVFRLLAFWYIKTDIWYLVETLQSFT